jgi:phosphatidylserine/phosphatidylglycerophosphate/cardiolipin synthase-like enzyme
MVTRDRASTAILTPGRTCWRLDRADRFRCIQDGADYFRFVLDAILKARHTIFILGWDIAGRVNLLPGHEHAGEPVRLDELLAFVAKRNPRLRCYVLIWDYGSLYTLERDPLSRFRLGWRTPRRVRFGYDDHHPFGASHHQKVVVVDDRLAFSGSLDLTGHRWDTSEHRVDEPARVTPTGKAYTPYHEVQAMLEGPAAASLGELARDRWRILGAKKLPPVQPVADSLWPRDVEPDLVDVDVAISRTVPGSADTPPVRECETLFFDSIEAAKKTLFIENQYFTSERLGAALAARLAEPDGPEVVVISPHECHGWLEKTTMGAFRETVFRRLRAADTHGRLRLVYPMASRARDVATFIHSKVMVVDDDLIRIGSANFSNRSLGMDTECDISVEALGSQRLQLGIRAMRDRLIGEHLGVDADTIGREYDRLGSLRAVIDAHAGGDRALLVIEPVDDLEEPTEAVRDAADPAEPAGFGPEIDRLLPALEANEGRSHLRLWIVPAIVVLAGNSRLVLESLERSGFLRISGAACVNGHELAGTWMAAGLFVICAWLFVPVEFLVLGSAVAFGPTRGAAVSAIGSIGAAGERVPRGPRAGSISGDALAGFAHVPDGPAACRAGPDRGRRHAPRHHCDGDVGPSAVRGRQGPVSRLPGRQSRGPGAASAGAECAGRPAPFDAPRTHDLEWTSNNRVCRPAGCRDVCHPYVVAHQTVRAIHGAPSKPRGVRLMHGPRRLFRVATYNVHSCVGPDGRHDPARIAGVIAELDADVVALQEFSYPADIALETRTPVVLTELDTYVCALGPTRQNPTHCFGNVILTRHRLREVHRVDLSVLNREPRGRSCGDDRRGRHRDPRARGAPRPQAERAPFSGPADRELSGVGARHVRGRAR